jgi:hypothetical protein
MLANQTYKVLHNIALRHKYELVQQAGRVIHYGALARNNY